MRRWIALMCASIALVVGAVAGLGQVVARQNWQVEAGASTVAPDVFGTPSTPTPATEPSPMPDPDAVCLTAALNAVPPVGDGAMTGQVIGLASGAVLWDRDAGRPMTPASNEKLLTTLALVDALGQDALATTYKTSVVAGAGDRVILVGGGDPYLASSSALAVFGQPATLDDLAAATAAALTAQGRATVTVGFDDTAFTGPDWHATWGPDDVTDVTRISSLMVDEGMTPGPGEAKGSIYRRSATPARDAAATFAAELRAHGIGVTDVAQTGEAAPAGAPSLASIDSLPLSDIIDLTLLMSNNTAAEVLMRHLAIAEGHPGSFTDGAQAITDFVAKSNLAAPGLQIVDGSGLSVANAVPAATLAGVVAAAAKSDGPAREVIARLPVAAANGTLLDRFQKPEAATGRGWVHAKTGSLTGVASLTGYTVTTSGQWLAFALVINGSTRAGLARDWLDRTAATLTTAQC